MPVADADKVREELRRAADNPEERVPPRRSRLGEKHRVSVWMLWNGSSWTKATWDRFCAPVRPLAYFGILRVNAGTACDGGTR